MLATLRFCVKFILQWFSIQVNQGEKYGLKLQTHLKSFIERMTSLQISPWQN